MRILTFSTLYPNAEQKVHGIFVEYRLRQLLGSGRVQARVVAPVPWFPSADARFGAYARFARVPAEEERHGIPVLHPRYPVVPKVGMNVAPLGLALAAYRAAQRVRAEGFDFDLIDAHYYYPDGVAAALLARWLERPLVITARGTDINLIPAHAIPRRMVLWASRVAAHSISVCEALRTEMIALGMPPERVTTLRNGVDLQRFAPVERDAARARLGWGAGHVLLSVGLLIERKGHDLVIRALRELTDSRAVIVGRGELGSSLRALAQAEGVADRVTFVDEIEQSELRYYYSAADALVLGSSREGWANVLLEAMACGTPVVASNVWGTPEVVAAPEAGLLMRDRTPAAIVECVRRLRAAPPERAATRRFAERFSWDATTEGQLRIFERVLAERDSRRVRAAARGA